jgi:hypothetical protein
MLSSSSASGKPTLIYGVVGGVVGLVLLTGVVALLLWLRKRRNVSRLPTTVDTSMAPVSTTNRGMLDRRHLLFSQCQIFFSAYVRIDCRYVGGYEISACRQWLEFLLLGSLLSLLLKIDTLGNYIDASTLSASSQYAGMPSTGENRCNLVCVDLYTVRRRRFSFVSAIRRSGSVASS